ncbi:helix-turn-helix domain-containing protein [Vibrio paracholerae]|uniref:helix-turn-helix domain-containing protein n=1 Tax=Vibrio paracholerae TaxID=650003 RepID=UPI0020951B9F|nr:hypothetical protein [Vibrio paracholerae]
MITDLINLDIIKPKTIEVVTLNAFMAAVRGNQTQAAIYLEINRGTLRKYLKKDEYYRLEVIRNSIGDVINVKIINK